MHSIKSGEIFVNIHMSNIFFSLRLVDEYPTSPFAKLGSRPCGVHCTYEPIGLAARVPCFFDPFYRIGLFRKPSLFCCHFPKFSGSWKNFVQHFKFMAYPVVANNLAQYHHSAGCCSLPKLETMCREVQRTNMLFSFYDFEVNSTIVSTLTSERCSDYVIIMALCLISWLFKLKAIR